MQINNEYKQKHMQRKTKQNKEKENIFIAVVD